jgi:L-amino acid N-acyltransferase YncA
MEIRLALEEDYDEIFEIYWENIKQIFPINIPDKAAFKMKFETYFRMRRGIFNYWVAIVENSILGWHSLNPISHNPLKAEWRAETSIYVKNNFKNQNIGSELLKYVLRIAKKHPHLYLIIGWVSKTNESSVKMLKKAEAVFLSEIEGSKKIKTDNKILITFYTQ